MAKEYIEREAVLKELKTAGEKEGEKSYRAADNGLYDVSAKYTHGEYCYCVACEIVTDTPAADVVEVKHGKWKLHKDGSGTCNQCRRTQKNIWDYDNWQNYCGHCGAKMDIEEGE